MRNKLLLSACSLVLVLGGCNGTQTTVNTDNLQNQINETRSQLAQIRAEVTDIQSEMRMLNGRIEELNFGQQRSGSSSEIDVYTSRVGSMDARLDRIEAYLTSSVAVKDGQPAFQATSALPVNFTPAVTTDTTTPANTETTISIGAPDLPENDFYTKAKNTFDAGRYDEARVMFEDFVKFYPNSKIIDSAVFWIGETYYREDNYERAILEYQNLLDNYPNGNKVPAAIYKQGLAFIAIGDAANGKILLEDLVNRFPDSQEARVAANRLKNL